MPAGDRTGPWGLGPRTGRGRGYCSGFGAPGFMYPGPGLGYGGGFGFGRGFGRGMGRGFWRPRFGRFWGYPYSPMAPYPYPYGAMPYSPYPPIYGQYYDEPYPGPRPASASGKKA